VRRYSECADVQISCKSYLFPYKSVLKEITKIYSACAHLHTSGSAKIDKPSRAAANPLKTTLDNGHNSGTDISIHFSFLYLERHSGLENHCSTRRI